MFASQLHHLTDIDQSCVVSNKIPKTDKTLLIRQWRRGSFHLCNLLLQTMNSGMTQVYITKPGHYSLDMLTKDMNGTVDQWQTLTVELMDRWIDFPGRSDTHQNVLEPTYHCSLASIFFSLELLYCGWTLTPVSDWIEILSTGEILFDRLRLVTCRQAVFFPREVALWPLNETFSRTPVVRAPAWLWLTVVWHCNMMCNIKSRRLITFRLQMEIFQLYCFKANRERIREESTGNVMSGMIDDGKDEGQVRTDSMNWIASS